jgi:hypothetical protein
VSPIIDLVLEKRKFLTLPGLKLRPHGNLALSQILHLLSSSGPEVTNYLTRNMFLRRLICIGFDVFMAMKFNVTVL